MKTFKQYFKRKKREYPDYIMTHDELENTYVLIIYKNAGEDKYVAVYEKDVYEDSDEWIKIPSGGHGTPRDIIKKTI